MCDRSITLHFAVSGKSLEVFADYDIDWINILLQILEGTNELHNVYKVLHNDIKSDDIVLAPGDSGSAINAVSVDSGRACDVKRGRFYHSSSQKRQEYKVNDPQTAPDI